MSSCLDYLFPMPSESRGKKAAERPVLFKKAGMHNYIGLPVLFQRDKWHHFSSPSPY